jgi:hypothetical protein
MSLLEVALGYAEAGRALFPCLPNAKEPACKRGFRDATTNPATICRWWRNTDYNIGIATGIASGVFVLDVDGTDGAASLAELEAKHGPLPATATSTTGRGRHLWFATSTPVPCSAGRVGIGLDIRGDGGYVVAPPSIHPNGRRYEWLRSDDPVEPPTWLLELARKKPASTISQRAMNNLPPAAGLTHRYGEAALQYEIDALAKTPPGGRNNQLNRASFSLHQLVAGGELDAGTVHDRLVAASEANGLLQEDGMRAVLATINSGARAGLQLPRNRGGAL